MQSEFNGILLVLTRRHAVVRAEDGSTYSAKIGVRDLETAVGDRVIYTLEPNKNQGGATAIVQAIVPRKNLLQRADRTRTKRLVANLDHLFIVTAPEPLFNTTAIDRVIAAAEAQNIPWTLVLNKADLKNAVENTLPLLAPYQKLQTDVLSVSAASGENLSEIQNVLESDYVQTVAFTGVSGVGKSSLLQALIPDLELRTGTVSTKTGQGRQTTSQAAGFAYQRKDGSELLIFDLPGIQNFGVCHLTEAEIHAAFPELESLRPSCRFADCRHLLEPECKVLEARAEGEVAESRYRSYREMLEEVRAYQTY